jgi:hypothetical protein
VEVVQAEGTVESPRFAAMPVFCLAAFGVNGKLVFGAPGRGLRASGRGRGGREMPIGAESA